MTTMPGRLGAALAALTAAMLLSGCNNSRNSSLYGQYFGMVRQAWSNGFGGGSITREQAAKISYASMGYRLNGGGQHLIVLATDTQGTMLWTSAERIVLQTRGGRIVRTVGLPRDITAMTTASEDLPPPAAALRGPFTTTRQMDFADLRTYGISLRCTTASRARVNITILGAKIPTVRVEEKCQATNADWRFTNIYWVDGESGLVWQSRQILNPKGDVLQTEIFRPPG